MPWYWHQCPWMLGWITWRKRAAVACPHYFVTVGNTLPRPQSLAIAHLGDIDPSSRVKIRAWSLLSRQNLRLLGLGKACGGGRGIQRYSPTFTPAPLANFCALYSFPPLHDTLLFFSFPLLFPLAHLSLDILVFKFPGVSTFGQSSCQRVVVMVLK